MVYVHTILRDVAGLFKVGRLVAYVLDALLPLIEQRIGYVIQFCQSVLLNLYL